MELEELSRRLRIVEQRWTVARAELRVTRDWRVEAYLHFELIDLKRAHELILSQIAALTAV